MSDHIHIDQPPPHIVAHIDQMGAWMKTADPLTDPNWLDGKPDNPEAQAAADAWLNTQLRKAQ